MMKRWGQVAILLLAGGVILVVLLCFASYIYLDYRRQVARDQFYQARVRICHNLLEAGLISTEAACGSGVNPHNYLPILFPQGKNPEYVAVGMQGFELHEVLRGNCTRYYYTIFDFIFQEFVRFQFCDDILVDVEFED